MENTSQSGSTGSEGGNAATTGGSSAVEADAQDGAEGGGASGRHSGRPSGAWGGVGPSSGAQRQALVAASVALVAALAGGALRLLLGSVPMDRLAKLEFLSNGSVVDAVDPCRGVDLSPGGHATQCEVPMVTSKPRWAQGSARTRVNQSQAWTSYSQLWHNAGSWYALVEGGPDKAIKADWKMSRNTRIQAMHVSSANAFATNTDVAFVPGTTLLLDYSYWRHPGAIGHWGGDVLYPLYSTLRELGRPTIDRVIILHIKHRHLIPWVRHTMAVALDLELDNLPPITLMRTAEPVGIGPGPGTPLFGLDDEKWYVFEHGLHVHDTFSGGKRGFKRAADHNAWRDEMYRRAGVGPGWSEGNQITFHLSPPRPLSNGRRVVNEGALLELLAKYGPVQTVQFRSDTSFEEQVQTMANSSIFVAVHTSVLTNAVLLRPGAAVFEITPCMLQWGQLEEFMKTLTSAAGDIHHFAWRCMDNKYTHHHDPADTRKFAHWTKEECMGSECVEAAIRVDVELNLEEFERLLDARVPQILAGQSAQSLDVKWEDMPDLYTAKQFEENAEPSEADEEPEIVGARAAPSTPPKTK